MNRKYMDQIHKIYDEYFDDVYKYVLAMSKDPSLSEEITQETFFKAIKNFKNFKGESRIYTWLCQIAKNLVYDYYRKNKKEVIISFSDDWADLDEDILKTLENEEQSIEIHKLLHKLSEPYKEVFTLRVFAELPYKRIGEIYKRTDTWARVVFYRAKNKLMEDLK